MPAKDSHLWADIQAGLVREVAAMTRGVMELAVLYKD